MEIDYKKLMIQTPKDVYDAIEMLIKYNSELAEAVHIMSSVVSLNGDEFKDVHEANIEKFLTKYAK